MLSTDTSSAADLLAVLYDLEGRRDNLHEFRFVVPVAVEAESLRHGAVGLEQVPKC